MTWWMWLILLLVVAAILLAAGMIARVREVRQAGTPVLFRALPAADDEGWRHGSVHYTEPALVYYRLTALLPGPTASLSRRYLDLSGRRSPVGTECEIMDDDVVILALRVNEPGRPEALYELAMDAILVTAFLSWLEARPPSRSRRPRRSA